VKRSRFHAFAGVALLACAACSFDASGIGGGDGGAGGDADPAQPDGGPGATDGAPADAAVAAAGTVISSRGASVVLDGNFDDWTDAPTYVFDIEDATDLHMGHPSYLSSAKLTFASQHDATYIYFALVLQDDLVVDAVHPLYDDDSVSIFLDAAGDAAGRFGADDHEIIIGSNGLYGDYASGGSALLDGVAVSLSDGWSIEAGIRKDSLGIAPLPTRLGFDIAMNDDDGLGAASFDAYGLWFLSERAPCATCCTGWDHPEAWCDTTTFGRLQLQ